MVAKLLRRNSLRYLGRHRWLTALSLASMALGVAIVVAVDLANSSAQRAFELSLQAVSGNTSHQIVAGPGGIDESIYVAMRTDLGLVRSAPIITEQIRINDARYTLIGADPMSEWQLRKNRVGVYASWWRQALRPAEYAKPTVMLSSSTAKSLGLAEGQTFNISVRGRAIEVMLAAIFDQESAAGAGGMVFADIAIAQELVNRVGRLDRIDVDLHPQQVEGLRAWLPAQLSLLETASSNQSMLKMSEAFQINLQAMSLLALLVGGLLIYNTVTFSVLRRRNTMGIYRSLGVSRREIFLLVLSESAVLAFIASGCGVLLGVILSEYLLYLVVQTISDLYFRIQVTQSFLSPWLLLKGFALGVGVSLIAATIPAWEASTNLPASVQQRSHLEIRWQNRCPILFAIGVVMVVAGFYLIEQEPGLLPGAIATPQLALIEGFVCLGAIVIGGCLMVPAVVLLLSSVLARGLGAVIGVSARLAIQGIRAGISRTGVAVAALAVAVSITVGVGTMVSSFRHTVIFWLQQSFNGDVYITQPGRSLSAREGITPELLQQLPELPGVSSSSTSRHVSVETEFGTLRLLAIDSDRNRNGDSDRNGNSDGDNSSDSDSDSDQHWQRVALKESIPDALPLFLQGQGVVISEPLAYHQKKQPGDSVEIHTDSGPVSFMVLGVFYDYSSSQGLIALHDQLYRRYWNDKGVSGLTLYRDPAVSQQQLVSAVNNRLAAEPINYSVNSNQDIRDITLTVFDRTFVVTHVLRLLAVVVAFVGVLSALMALQLERMREYAIMRATGMTPVQVFAVVMLQTGTMGLYAGLLALPLGIVMSDVLVDVINRRSFGWSMQHVLPVSVFVEAMALAVIASLLAGIYPAYRAANISPALVLREE